jgi:hypothetical protein
MNSCASNVRPIRPMRILLVTDDVCYADQVACAASLKGVDLTLAALGDDLDAATTRNAPNVVVLDANNKLARVSRTATVFAALHPRIATVVVANRTPERSIGSVQIVNKWRSAEHLLRELEHAVLGFVGSTEDVRSTGEGSA